MQGRLRRTLHRARILMQSWAPPALPLWGKGRSSVPGMLQRWFLMEPR